MQNTWQAIVCMLAACVFPGAADAAEPSARPSVAASDSPIALGSRRELFVDRLLIDRLDNAALKLHEPVSAGVAIRIDKPWEGRGSIGI